MDVSGFIAKWRQSELTERSAAQQHFLDLCEVFAHPKPAEADPLGEWYTFERGAEKHGGGDGWADVWKRGFFGWEYKGKHKNLSAAYDQLLKYRESLENPPLLVVCDMDRLIVHTNFTGTVQQVHEVPLDELGDPRNIEVVRAVFHDPDKLKPGVTSMAVTTDAASRIGSIAQSMRERGIDPAQAARFLDRVIFCLFAEDVQLLPDQLFRRLVEKSERDPKRFTRLVGQLFAAMAEGGDFGLDTIRHFNGNLFADASVLELTPGEIARVQVAARLDWGAVDPSILGTLFERGMDPNKRAQLGAQYTGRADIEVLVNPVVIDPLRREWAAARALADNLRSTGKRKPTGREQPPTREVLAKGRREARIVVQDFLQRLQDVTVLDPACGSGNFLFVTLQKLKDLEKEVLVYADDQGIGGFFPMVGPWQLRGIEIDPYAFDLAQISIWIGWLQWSRVNGYRVTQDHILRPMDTFKRMDAILDRSDPDNPREPDWPDAEFIIGNPPYLGGKKLRSELGDDNVDSLFRVWRGRVRPEADLCCYWFEKARALIAANRCKRAGLLATQGIRAGASRETLKRIKATGDIFFAESDRNWVLDGANVHVSMVGFDAGIQTIKVLDHRPASTINSDLTATAADVTTAQRLTNNLGSTYMGDTKGGSFDITEALAFEFLNAPNPTGLPNSDVLVPWINGLDVTRRARNVWIIDFGTDTPIEVAAGYEKPFEHLRMHVLHEREKNKRKAYRDRLWLHVEARPALRMRMVPLSRFIVTPAVSKHRVFTWKADPVLPDHKLYVFVSSEDYLLGVLHSRLHEVWSRAQGSQVRERESGFAYTPTTCFETFPFPEPTDAQRASIADAAKHLDTMRTGWLNPPEWTKEEVLEFPGSVHGPWSRYVHDPDDRGIGAVRYPRQIPRSASHARDLSARTLTNLYNKPPAWLTLAHRKLDEAVFASYGWEPGLTDDEVLARLLARNLGFAIVPRAVGGFRLPRIPVDRAAPTR